LQSECCRNRETENQRENWDFVEETSVRENRFLAFGLLPLHLSSWQFDPWTFVWWFQQQEEGGEEEENRVLIGFCFLLMALATNACTPCAACKLLRRRCAQECPFSPYFSPHEPQKFASVHKVFGASNVSKMLMDVPENQRADAVSSLVYEANARIRDPVYGCMGVIYALQQQIRLLQAELSAVRKDILRYKTTHQQETTILPVSASSQHSPAATAAELDNPTTPSPAAAELLFPTAGSTPHAPVDQSDPEDVHTPESKEHTYWDSTLT
jgi:hypothetical protein